MRQISKRVRWLGAVLLLLLTSLTAQGQEFTVGQVTYECRGSGDVAVKQIAISSEISDDTIVIDIPEHVSYGGTDYAVTAVGTGEGCGSVLTFGTNVPVTTVRIPSTVRDLYAGTFAYDYGTYTVKVSLEFLPNTNIKSWPVGMFKDSQLKRLVLPEGVWTDIPADFCRNTPPVEMVLPGNCRTIGDYAFASADDNPKPIKSMKFNYGLKTIGSHAFYNTSPITEDRTGWQNGPYTLTIPSSVTTLGESAFEGMRDIFCVEIPGTIKTPS